jgi:hypothetical protein
VADVEHLVERLRAIEEELRDLAFDRLRAASGARDDDRGDGEGRADHHGDEDALAQEKRFLQARRAIARAIGALGGTDASLS